MAVLAGVARGGAGAAVVGGPRRPWETAGAGVGERGVGERGAAVVVTGRCVGCGACLATCPQRALRAAVPIVVLAERCDGCGECVEICPVDALEERW